MVKSFSNGRKKESVARVTLLEMYSCYEQTLEDTVCQNRLFD
jgi:hypothetical protein